MVSEYEYRKPELRWERKSASRWLLKATTGEIFGAVFAYRDSSFGPRHSFLFKALVVGRRVPEGRAWTTARGVAAAKRAMVAHLGRWSWEDFSVAEAA